LAGVPAGTYTDNSEYMNHCCEPNAIFVNDRYMIAGRDIEVDEEVTYDYSTSETADSAHFPLHCRCGLPACRGTITGADCLKPDVRAKYAGQFTSHVVRLQQEHDARNGSA
jgi:hypothetical protein